MAWYLIKTKNITIAKKYLKKRYKCKFWVPSEELFEDTLFLDIKDKKPIDEKYKFQLLTPELYKKVTEYDCKMIGLADKKEEKIQKGKKIKVVSPLLSFDATVENSKKRFVNIKINLDNRELKMSIPRTFIKPDEKK